MSAKCIGIYRPPFRMQSGGAIQFSPSPNRSAPQWSATRKVPLVDFWRKSWIDVAKSSYHHVSQIEIDGDNPGYPTLIQLGRTPWVIQPVFIDLPRYAS
jgi:hypothetical protein